MDNTLTEYSMQRQKSNGQKRMTDKLFRCEIQAAIFCYFFFVLPVVVILLSALIIISTFVEWMKEKKFIIIHIFLVIDKNMYDARYWNNSGKDREREGERDMCISFSTWPRPSLSKMSGTEGKLGHKKETGDGERERNECINNTAAITKSEDIDFVCVIELTHSLRLLFDRRNENEWM